MLAQDWRRGTLNKYVSLLIKNALIDIQRYVEEYRSGHVNHYGPGDVEIHGTASIGRLPIGAYIEQMRMRTTGYTCRNYHLNREAWDARFNLSCCDAVYKVAINPVGHDFWVNPQIIPGRQLELHWNGIKTSWQDSETVVFDGDVALAVADYCMIYLSRRINNDNQASAAYQQSYMQKRKDLYLTANERKWGRTGEDRASSIECAPSCPPYDADAAVEWVCFGDSGDPTTISDTEAVADLALEMAPDFIVHLGDTNYPNGDPATVFDNMLKHYGSYIRSAWYQVMGNHDYDTDVGAYLLTQLPAVQSLMDETNVSFCYKFTRGLVDFFVVNTGGTGADSIDEATAIPVWLTAALAASTNTWKVVFMHKSPSSSGVNYYPGVTGVDWDALTGADVVIGAHSHNYERLLIDGQTRFVVGTGGGILRGFNSTPIDGSQFRYSAKPGLLRCSADQYKMQFVFYNKDKDIVDNFTLYPTT